MSSTTLAERCKAIVRGIPTTYCNALVNHFGEGPSDLELAKKQHAAYIGALRNHGVEVIEIPADDNYPDCVFVEDLAVVLGKRCFIPRLGHESRRGETRIVVQELEGYLEIVKMNGTGIMDGGDVLRIGDILFIGRSTRTDDAGIAEFRTFVEDSGFELRVIDVSEHVLHLTSMCSSPTEDILLLTEGTASAEEFGDLPGIDIIMVPTEEIRGANVIGFGNRMIVADGFPVVCSELTIRGFELTLLDISQISAADASLTCCSVFFF